MTLKNLYEYGVSTLKQSNIDDADFDARELLLSCAAMSSTQFLLDENKDASAKIEDEYKKLISRRCSGEPLQYIIGKWSFLNCELFVGKGVLIPRPETEQLADICINIVKSNKISVVYDLCAGSGCIGISIAKACPDTKVFLFEKYAEAVEYCKKNIELNRVPNVKVFEYDIFDGLPGNSECPQLIVSNPPYIPDDELENLQKEVLFEPESALNGGSKGLVFYKALADKWIKNAASLKFCAVECGEKQSDEIAEMFSLYGETECIRDIFSTDRFVKLKITNREK